MTNRRQNKKRKKWVFELTVYEGSDEFWESGPSINSVGAMIRTELYSMDTEIKPLRKRKKKSKETK